MVLLEKMTEEESKSQNRLQIPKEIRRKREEKESSQPFSSPMVEATAPSGSFLWIAVLFVAQTIVVPAAANRWSLMVPACSVLLGDGVLRGGHRAPTADVEIGPGQ